jgi:hypothetical protein
MLDDGKGLPSFTGGLRTRSEMATLSGIMQRPSMTGMVAPSTLGRLVSSGLGTRSTSLGRLATSNLGRAATGKLLQDVVPVVSASLAVASSLLAR